MKILVISPQNAFPPVDGGKIGIFYPIKYLAKNNDIFYAFPVYDLNEAEITKLVNNYRKFNINAIPIELNTKDRLDIILKSLFSTKAFKSTKYLDNNFLKQLLNVVEKEGINAIFVNHYVMGWYAIKIKEKFKIPIILREHNIEYMLAYQFFRNEINLIVKFVAFFEYLKIKRFEKSLWTKFDKVFFISDSDLEEVKKSKIQCNYDLLYDGMEITETCLSENIEEENNSFVITAGLNSYQNIINFKYFIHEIWKKFVIKNPKCKLYITGDGQKQLKDVLNFNEEEISKFNIIHLGFVDNIEEVIRSKKYVVSPTICGSGLRLKVLQALALNKAVFVSEIDYKMVKYFKDMENIMLFENFEDFETKYKQLENDSILYYKITQNACILARNLFDWNKYSNIIEKDFKKIFAKNVGEVN